VDARIIVPARAAGNPRDSGYAWLRLAVSVLLATVGSVGMWSVVVALPAVQAEFGVSRGDASLPYTLTTIGYACGGILTGRLADRFGVALPLVGGAVTLAAGYLASAAATDLWQFALAQGLLVGGGCSAMFGPLIADISHWFSRRRGIAVAICASGSYLAGAIWPPIVQHLITTEGWRRTHVHVGLFCLVALLALALALRRRPPMLPASGTQAPATSATLALRPNLLMIVLSIAGFACCVAMSMPQVHIVAYCGDLGYGVARGAEMLSVMLGCGIVSRIASGWIADRVGGLATLLLGSVLQVTALTLYLAFDGLSSLFVISGLFGLFQGGIVPSYAIIVREYFSPQEAGGHLGIVLMATLFGMAAGGWMSGVIFDRTGSYQAAFANGVLWNLLNITIAVWLLLRRDRSSRQLAAA